MNGFGIQDALALAAAAAALAWLVARRVRARRRGRLGCEDCPGCSPARGLPRANVTPQASAGLIEIDPLPLQAGPPRG